METIQEVERLAGEAATGDESMPGQSATAHIDNRSYSLPIHDLRAANQTQPLCAPGQLRPSETGVAQGPVLDSGIVHETSYFNSFNGDVRDLTALDPAVSPNGLTLSSQPVWTFWSH